ncbi:Heat shock protein 70 [Fasciola gigantica]|uniref:Heat shock protein 70 n=1 Tax=Fasciola gigantica TaxID=46835 RepID=A0A504YLK5_FASGI|nr:Heat shock protein 70 [Fasciola gigantica]
MECHFIQKFGQMHKVDVNDNERAVRRLQNAFKRAEGTLIFSARANSETDSSYEGVYFYPSIIRAGFEELNADFFRSTLEPVEKALRDAKIDNHQIHDIV